MHTHSRWATTFAQAGRGIPALGTTHADYFYGEYPCTRPLKDEEIRERYEANTGVVIAERFQQLDHRQIPGVVVHEHGVFCWADTPREAVELAVMLEEIAFMAWHTIVLDPPRRVCSRACSISTICANMDATPTTDSDLLKGS